jgi:hypothetical protein
MVLGSGDGAPNGAVVDDDSCVQPTVVNRTGASELALACHASVDVLLDNTR